LASTDNDQSLDEGEDPGAFTAAGILTVLAVGVGVFFLLYSALAAPNNGARGLISEALPPGVSGNDALAVLRTATSAPTSSPSPSPTPMATPTVAPTPSATSTVVPTPTSTAVPPTVTPVPTPPLPTPTPTQLPVLLRVINPGNPLNIRLNPTSNSPVLEQVEHGSLMQDLGRSRQVKDVSWREVRTPNGTVGWAVDIFLWRQR